MRYTLKMDFFAYVIVECSAKTNIGANVVSLMMFSIPTYSMIFYLHCACMKRAK
jgi:hypothetical protein